MVCQPVLGDYPELKSGLSPVLVDKLWYNYTTSINVDLAHWKIFCAKGGVFWQA